MKNVSFTLIATLNNNTDYTSKQLQDSIVGVTAKLATSSDIVVSSDPSYVTKSCQAISIIADSPFYLRYDTPSTQGVVSPLTKVFLFGGALENVQIFTPAGETAEAKVILIDGNQIYASGNIDPSSVGIGPQGIVGPTGPSGTVTVGKTQSVPYNMGASVTNTGTDTAAILDFNIPAGMSAYDLAVQNGFRGTLDDYLASLKGLPGTSLVNKGTWESGSVYQPGNIVYVPGDENGIYYLYSNVEYTSILRPDLDTLHWERITTPAGPQGIQGIQGVQGPAGNPAKISQVTSVPYGTAPTVTNVGSDVNPNYVISIPTGRTSTISIGEVSTLPPSSTPIVSNSGTNEDAVLNFQIPRGADGITPAISVGNVYTVPYNADPVITVSGPKESPVLSLGIPRGLTGAQGEEGIQGQKGDKGDTGPAGQNAVIDAVTLTVLPQGQAAYATLSGPQSNLSLNIAMPRPKDASQVMDTYTLSSLPLNPTEGMFIFVSDARKTGEALGHGTGSFCGWDGQGWLDIARSAYVDNVVMSSQSAANSSGATTTIGSAGSGSAS